MIVIADVGADIVQSMLLVLREGGDAAADVMAALAALASPEPLIIVDWPRGGLVRL